MGSRSGTSSGDKQAPAPSPSLALRAVWACLALCLLLLLLLSRCPPCQGRELPAEAEGEGGKAMHFEGGGLVFRVPPAPASVVGEEEEPAAAAVPVPAPVPRRGFAAGRAARLMRSVPSPGVGH